ncbi:MAG TPA: helix-turn-helix domain-containing protein [Puia sp.]|nr:helix-turn-helix domain-containing protein [Puia sp.]
MSTKQEKMFSLLESKDPAQNVSAFCKEHHISEARFYYWQKKYREIYPEESDAGFAAIEYTNRSGSPVATVQLSSGTLITLYHAEALSYLQPLL